MGPHFVLSETTEREIDDMMNLFIMGATISALMAGVSLSIISGLTLEEGDYFAEFNWAKGWVGFWEPNANIAILSGLAAVFALSAVFAFMILYMSLCAMAPALQREDKYYAMWLHQFQSMIYLGSLLVLLSVEFCLPAMFYVGLLKVRKFTDQPLLALWCTLGVIFMVGLALYVYCVHRKHRDLLSQMNL